MIEENLSILLTDIGLEEERFAEAVEKASHTNFKYVLEELLWVDDFLKFKSFMLDRNKELNEEALRYLITSQH